MTNYCLLEATCGLVFAVLLQLPVYAQKNFNDYMQFYPIGEDPNISFRTSYVQQETILFDANPIVRYSFSNNFVKGLANDKPHTRAYYISFRPQLRMYTDNSFPVKTPSYRVLFGTQHLFRLSETTLTEGWHRFLGFSLESGHYSNGQDGCAFSELYKDGSKECDSIYRLITPDTNLSELLNRESGNFSTNLTEFIADYRWLQLDDDDRPSRVHNVKAGFVLYHDRFLGIGSFGGFSDDDIKIYGRLRCLLGYAYTHVFKNGKGRRLTVSENVVLIQNPHRHINPFRSETSVTYNPSLKFRTFGVFFSYIYGHDNYNFRFVDSGHQAALGLTWSQFPPFAMKKL